MHHLTALFFSPLVPMSTALWPVPQLIAPPPPEHLEQSLTTNQNFLTPPRQRRSTPLSHVLLLLHKPYCSPCLSITIFPTWPHLYCAPGLPVFPLTATICMSHLQHEVLNRLPVLFSEHEQLWENPRLVKESPAYTITPAAEPSIAAVWERQQQQKLHQSITFAPRRGCRHTAGSGGNGWVQK